MFVPFADVLGDTCKMSLVKASNKELDRLFKKIQPSAGADIGDDVRRIDSLFIGR